MQLKTSLLPHQQVGVDKLLPLKIGALYMDMGTGKTRTALEIIQIRFASGKLSRVVWLCPCSVKANLAADLDKHSEGWRNIISIYGIESLSGSKRLGGELLGIVSAAKDTMLIVDESNLVKNPAAIRSRRITLIAARCKYRMILNGTPISRNEADLFSQWYLMDWRVLGYRSFWAFAANHLEYDEETGRVRRALHTDYLARKIAPYTYQVRRDECINLPDKNYHTVYWEMSAAQDEEYERAYKELLLQLDDLKPETIYRMFSGLQAVISGCAINFVSRDHYTLRPLFDDPEDNPHVAAFFRLLQRRIGDEKVLVYCKYTHEILTLRDLLARDNGPSSVVTLYGDDSIVKRAHNVDAFKGPAQFMVANKTCAGYGLNLQFCHNVIYYSNDWDYSTRIQSEDRVHRLGQDNDVHIYDLVCQYSLDVRIQESLQRKEALLNNLKNELTDADKDRETALREFFFGKRRQKRGGCIDGESIRDD